MTDRETELRALRERAKELRCLYRVVEVLSDRERSPDEAFRLVLDAVPPGWQYPDLTEARIEYLGRSATTPGFRTTAWMLRAPVRIWLRDVGTLEVGYRSLPDGRETDPFLPEERTLLDTIAARLGEYLEWKQQQLGSERIGAGVEHWRWRQRFAERLAASIRPGRWPVEVHLGGSTASGEAGPASDIDLFVVFRGSAAERHELDLWLEGWSLCLAEVAYVHAGVRVAGGLLDVHFVDDVAGLDPPPRALQAG